MVLTGRHPGFKAAVPAARLYWLPAQAHSLTVPKIAAATGLLDATVSEALTRYLGATSHPAFPAFPPGPR